MPTLPKDPDATLKEEWEGLWKKFAEILGFMYDNEGVISSLKKQIHLKGHEEAKQTIDHQIAEVRKLVDHHVADLVQLVKKAPPIAEKKGKNIHKECDSLVVAVQGLNIDEIQSKVKDLKGKMKD